PGARNIASPLSAAQRYGRLAEAFGEGGLLRLRIRRAETAIIADGSQIHRASLTRTRSPRGEKKPTPIGETWIGRHGKKYRWLLNGAKSAMPRPPLVSASSRP